MTFIFGIITGLILAVIALMVGLQARRKIDKALREDFKPSDWIAPKKGAIYEAPLDIDLAREKIIEKNDAEGRETRIDELL